MKLWLKILLIALAALLLLVVFAPNLVSQLLWHRSSEASFFALQLRMAGRDRMQGDAAAWFAEKATENAGELTLPEDMALEPERRSYGGMDYYVFNAQERPERLIVYFAGGTYLDRPQDEHFLFAASLAADSGAELWLPDYPKLPDHSAGEAYATLLSFGREVLDEKQCDSLLFMGDSAGGGMALSLAQQRRDAGEATPDALILLSPWLDVAMTDAELYTPYQRRDPKLDRESLQAAGSAWAGELSTKDPVVSPLYGDCAGLGHICLYAGTRELLYPDILHFSERLKDADLPHSLSIGEGMNHIWPLYRAYGVPEAEAAYQSILAAISAS